MKKKGCLTFIKDFTFLMFISAIVFVIFGFAGYYSIFYFIKGQTVKLPYLHRKDLITSMETLSKLGLKSQLIGQKFNTEIPRQGILEQYPLAGTKVKKGSVVKLVISKGPEKVEVPSLINISLKKARLLLEQNALDLGTISYFYSEHIPRDYIIRQSAPAGALENQNAKINLLISLGKKDRLMSTPNLVGMRIIHAKKLLNDMHLILDTQEEIVTTKYPANTVIGQIPQPNVPIQENEGIKLKIAIGPYDYSYYSRRIQIPMVSYLRTSSMKKSFLTVEIEDEFSKVQTTYLLMPGKKKIILPLLIIGKGTIRIYEDGYYRKCIKSENDKIKEASRFYSYWKLRPFRAQHH